MKKAPWSSRAEVLQLMVAKLRLGGTRNIEEVHGRQLLRNPQGKGTALQLEPTWSANASFQKEIGNGRVTEPASPVQPISHSSYFFVRVCT
jgi:hypothetical protein